MEDFLKQVNPGQTMNIGTSDHLTQIQHKGPYVEIVDHFDHGPLPVDWHEVVRVNPNGSLEYP